MNGLFDYIKEIMARRGRSVRIPVNPEHVPAAAPENGADFACDFLTTL